MPRTHVAQFRDPYSTSDSKIASAISRLYLIGSATFAFPMLLAEGISTPMAPNGLRDWMANFVDTSASTTASFEASVLNDASHLAIDLITLVSPASSCLLIRAATLLGRILSMAADYIPDHSMLPDELMFQSLMLTFSWISFVQAVLPRFLASTSLTSPLQLRDGKAYKALFAPTGMTWEQFKTVSACATDWIVMEPHQDIATGNSTNEASTNGETKITDANKGGDVDYVYWLYSGDMVVQNNHGRDLYTVSSAGGGQRIKQDAARGLFGEAGLLRRLDGTGVGPITAANTAPADMASTIPTMKARTGPSGATMLRLHTNNLRRLVSHDEDLAKALRMLLFQGLTAKLGAKFEATTDSPNQPQPDHTLSNDSSRKKN